MRARTRTCVGIGALVVAAACSGKVDEAITKGTDRVVGSVPVLAKYKDDRIRSKAPGTWVCHEQRPRPARDNSKGTVYEAGTDFLVVTIGGDGTFAYEKHEPADRVQYSGWGNWTLDNGNLEIRVLYESRDDNGWRLTGVSDDATSVFIEGITFRTNGSRVVKEKGGAMPVKIVDDDHVVFDVGRGYLWACDRDAKTTPATAGPSIVKPVRHVGEVIGKVKLDPAPTDKPRYPQIGIVPEGDELGGGYVVATDEDGNFSIEVTPGTYTVSDKTSFSDDPHRCDKKTIEITEGTSTQVELTCGPPKAK